MLCESLKSSLVKLNKTRPGEYFSNMAHSPYKKYLDQELRFKIIEAAYDGFESVYSIISNIYDINTLFIIARMMSKEDSYFARIIATNTNDVHMLNGNKDAASAFYFPILRYFEQSEYIFFTEYFEKQLENLKSDANIFGFGKNAWVDYFRMKCDSKQLEITFRKLFFWHKRIKAIEQEKPINIF